MLGRMLHRAVSGKAPAAFSTSAYGIVDGSFESLCVHSSLVGKLGRMGVFKPSAVQAEVLPVIGAKSATDVVFHAPTGRCFATMIQRCTFQSTVFCGTFDCRYRQDLGIPASHAERAGAGAGQPAAARVRDGHGAHT